MNKYLRNLCLSTLACAPLLFQAQAVWAGVVIHEVKPKRIVFKNTGTEAVQLANWYIQNTNQQKRYLTQTNQILQPGQTILRKLPNGGTTTQLSLVNPSGETKDSADFPTSLVWPVAFTTQAPTGNWGHPFGEACEEASLLMAQHYFNGSSFDADEISKAILTLVDWENAVFGKNEDTSATETARIAHERLGMKARVSNKVSVLHIKRALQAGHLVLAPVYGNDLHNPHYGGGLLYHVVLIIGYDGTDFITNDAGTRYGNHYRYNQDLLVNAIHDLGVPESATADSNKAIIVLGD